MMTTVRTFTAIGVSATIAMGATARPALAISVELATKCRDMALKAHPYKLPGQGPGTAAAERTYYSDCLAKGGNMPDATTQNVAPGPSSPPPAAAPSQAPTPAK